jgi:hypothetical protein
MHSILAITEFKIPNSGLMNCIGLLLQKKIVLLKQLINRIHCPLLLLFFHHFENKLKKHC